MPKQLELVRPLILQQGVLLKRDHLQTSLRATKLIQDAQRRAARIVQQAEQDADRYRQQAYLQGYGEGVLAGTEALVQQLDDAQSLSLQLAAQQQSALKAQLTEILSHPELALSLAEDWLAQQTLDAEVELELHIPRAWQLAQHQLHQRFSTLPRVRLFLHEGSHFTLRHGDRLHEFSPTSAAQECLRALLPSIGLETLPAACAQIAREAQLQFWQHAAMGDPHDHHDLQEQP